MIFECFGESLMFILTLGVKGSALRVVGQFARTAAEAASMCGIYGAT
jgi:hypothetical protein